MTGSKNIQTEYLCYTAPAAPRPSGSALRMAPMIDMIFLLLIFLLVSAKWRPQEDFLPFQLPAADAPQAIPGRPEPLEIYIAATATGCTVRIGGCDPLAVEDRTALAELAGLQNSINHSLRSQKRTVGDPVEIICSPEVKWQHLAKIYNILFGIGFTDVTFRMTR